MAKSLLARFSLVLLLPVTISATYAQSLYFPPAGDNWEHIDPASINWDPARLSAALDVAGDRHSSGVVILHNGRILAERYWDLIDPPRAYGNSVQGKDAAGHVIEDVASAQKSIVAVLIGMAQERQLLRLDDPISQYLGAGWSKASPEQEKLISIAHLLSMSSGLKDDLSFDATAGTTWYYNTPAYHMLMRVVEAAAGKNRDALTREWFTDKLGMVNSGWTARPWASADIAVGFSTTARELARFGLMIQAGGRWREETLLGDSAYLSQMLAPSQSMNPAYGYLWWLNGQPFSRAAGAGAPRHEGFLIKAAPADLVAMQGALDRKLYIIPSLGLVIARLGSTGEADNISFNDAFWEALLSARQ